MKVNKKRLFVKAIYIKIKAPNGKIFNIEGVGDISSFPKSPRLHSYDKDLSSYELWKLANFGENAKMSIGQF